MNLEKERVEISEYIKILVKRKKLILTVLGFSLICSIVLVFLLPTRYLVSSLLEVGMVGNQPIEPVSQVVEKIQAGVYGPAWDLKINDPENTRLIKIEFVSSNLQEAIQRIEELNKNILAEHATMVELRKKLLEDEIKNLEQRVKVLAPKGRETANLELRITELQKEKEAIQLTQVLQGPVAVKSLSPQPALLILSFLFLGIIFGLFLAFFVEWWQRLNLWF
jgi:uncharacterized protein involved in exopolysaccharide biosynthesis